MVAIHGVYSAAKVESLVRGHGRTHVGNTAWIRKEYSLLSSAAIDLPFSCGMFMCVHIAPSYLIQTIKESYQAAVDLKLVAACAHSLGRSGFVVVIKVHFKEVLVSVSKELTNNGALKPVAVERVCDSSRYKVNFVSTRALVFRRVYTAAQLLHTI